MGLDYNSNKIHTKQNHNLMYNQQNVDS